MTFGIFILQFITDPMSLFLSINNEVVWFVDPCEFILLRGIVVVVVVVVECVNVEVIVCVVFRFSYSY